MDSDPLLQEARRRGFAIIDWTKPESSGIAAGAAGKIPWTGAHPVAAITDAVWPGIRLNSGPNRDAVSAGSTGAPWIDANGWLVQLARARAPGKAIWLVSTPQRNRQNIVSETSYALAIADAEAWGARWLVTLDDTLAQSLAFRNGLAVFRWQKVVASLRFFEERRNLTSGQSRAVVAIVSTFSEPDESLATELLNLAARRNLLYSVMLSSQAPAADLKGLKAIIWIGEQSPGETLRRKLANFVEQGGVLIAPAWAGGLAVDQKALDSPAPGYSVRQLGQGRVAVPVTPWTDPYLLAAEAHILISHREDPVTVFNGGSVLISYTGTPGGALAQLVRYSASPPGQQVSVGLRHVPSSVKFTSIESPAGGELRKTNVKDGVELALPPFGLFAALELQR
jgi:hypothetical protein